MSVLYFEREPEPESMEEELDVDAYTSSTAEQHLEKLDDELVSQIQSTGLRKGLVLDMGTGPGSIPAKLCQRVPGLVVIGVDISLAMLRKAQEKIRESGLADRMFLVCADTSVLPFPGNRFDMVMSNSLLHHLHDPVPSLDEIARVLRKTGALLLKDLRRPPRFLYKLHVAYFGRKYDCRMRELFEASVRAAFTLPEAEKLLTRSKLEACTPMKWGSQYLLITKPPGNRDVPVTEYR